jgi:peptidoglycan/xylan/chitin deacetylase (PgdA/CDA1 family)
MRLDRMATLGASVALRRVGIVVPTPGIPILMYHSVSEDRESGVRPYYRLATSPHRFRTQMRWLKDNGYSVITLADAADRIATRELGRSRSVVVTFDDGFREFLTAAWPIMQALTFTATVFLPTGFIADTRRAFNKRECLTWSEVRELRASGVVFGSHTVNHPALYELDWREIRAELVESKMALENELDGPVQAFAYPYAFPQEDARFVNAIREQLSVLGYRIGVTTMIGRANARDNPLTMRRLPVNDCDDERLFAAKIEGYYDWLAHVQKLHRSFLGGRRPMKQRVEEGVNL